MDLELQLEQRLSETGLDFKGVPCSPENFCNRTVSAGPDATGPTGYVGPLLGGAVGLAIHGYNYGKNPPVGI